MVAQAATPDRLESPELNPSVAALLRVILITTSIMLLLVAAWLLVRRMTGHLQQPLSALALFLVGLMLVGLVALLRQGALWAGWRPSQLVSTATLLWLIPSLAILLLAWSLSIVGTGWTGLILFWGTLSAGEGIWWRVAVHGIRRGGMRPRPDEPVGTNSTSRDATSAPGDGPWEREETEDDLGEHLPPDVSQQLTRSNSDEQGDTIAGMLRACFQSGERSRSLHVAFCPPMMSRPRVNVVQMAGPRARIKAADVQPYGVRFDLRLTASSPQDQDVVIHFDASAPDSNREDPQRTQIALTNNNTD